MANIKYLVIHHTAGLKTDTMEQEKTIHINQGYKDIAYNGFIEWDGTFKKGRDWENPNQDQNAANYGLNNQSLSVSMAGNFENYSPSEAQEKTLIQVLATWAKRYNVPVQNIIGHYQVKDIIKNPEAATACPGKNCIKRLNYYRNEIQKYLEPKS
jgi:hypothetical protein